MIDPAQIPIPPATVWEGLRYCHDPRLVSYHFRCLRQAERALADATRIALPEIRQALAEIRRDGPFLEGLAERYHAVLGRVLLPSDFMYLTRIDQRPPFRVVTEEAGDLFVHGPIQYALVRLLRPEVVVETGGTPGNSSAFILRALDRNGYGELHTIDLPPSAPLAADNRHPDWIHTGMPQGQTSGWAIPNELRDRHHLYLGDARLLLPEVLKSVPGVDIFIHDSDHSYTHMTWEFSVVWPHLRHGGVLMADDVGANAAWADFTAAHSLTPYRAFSLGLARRPRDA